MAHVLIIAHDPQAGNLLRNHLAEEGYKVTVTHRAQEGLTEALKHTPDLILLDLVLPDATGFQICNQLRRTAATQAVPIILISGVSHYDNQKAFALERGANEYIGKSVQVVEVGEIVDRYIGSKREKNGSSPLPSQAPGLHPRANDFSALRDFLNNAAQKPQNH